MCVHCSIALLYTSILLECLLTTTYSNRLSREALYCGIVSNSSWWVINVNLLGGGFGPYLLLSRVSHPTALQTNVPVAFRPFPAGTVMTCARLPCCSWTRSGTCGRTRQRSVARIPTADHSWSTITGHRCRWATESSGNAGPCEGHTPDVRRHCRVPCRVLFALFPNTANRPAGTQSLSPRTTAAQNLLSFKALYHLRYPPPSHLV